MKFSYTVVNKEGRKLTGTIDAENEGGARDELNKLGFPVIDMMQVNEETAAEILGKTKKFEFEAIDQTGRRILGTISAEDRGSAFKRLVEEYHFTVEKIWQASASLDIQDQEKNLGVIDLYAELKKEAAEKEKPSQVQALEKEREEKEKFIRTHVEGALEKTKMLLAASGNKIKEEEKTSIERKADRLLRLKTSSNIEYVRHLAEELLLHIQNPEIFQERPEGKEQEKLNLEVKKLLSELHEDKIKPTLRQDILQQIQAWKKRNLREDEEPKGINRILNSVFSFIEDILTQPPEISSRNEKIQLLSREIFSYYKLLLRESSPQLREEIKESIKNLRQEKAKIKDELSEIKEKYRKEEELKEELSITQRMINELIALLGWIIFFYIGFHMLAIYKAFPEKFAEIVQISGSNKFTILLTILFIIYTGINIKKIFFAGKRFAGIVTTLFIIVSGTLILLNF